MDAGTSMACFQLGPESSRFSCPVVEEELLFDKIFDWDRYCRSTREPDMEPLHFPGHQTQHSQYMFKVKSHVSPSSLVFDNLAINDFRSNFGNMSSPLPSDDDSVTNSEYSGHSPPDLIQEDEAGSASPSDRSDSVFLGDDHHSEERTGHHADVTTLHQEVPAQHDVDEWIQSQTVVDQAQAARSGYPAHIASEEEYDDLQQTGSAGTKRRRSIRDIEKRPRQLADPMQTADVRKSGAKAFPNHAHLACTRMTPIMAWPVMAKVPDCWSGVAAKEDYLCSGPRFFTGNSREISILFSGDRSSSSLHVTVQVYRSTDTQEETGNPRTVDFPRDRVPSHSMLERWVERQMERESGPEFGLMLQNFLRVYSKEGVRRLPKQDLVRAVHKMNCFFRIWKKPSFMCIDPSNNLAPLPVSVQAQLRRIAKKALDRLEYDVLKILDDCLTQQGSPKPEERVAIWASLWQLMLMYRELLIAYKSHLGRMTQGPSSPDGLIAAQTQQYKRLIDCFFPLLATFYHYQFRTKKSIELSLTWLDRISPLDVSREDKAQICHLGQQLLASRRDLYRYIESTREVHDVNSMLWTFVVDHELKKLNARKRVPKGLSCRSNFPQQMETEFDDE
ncbi:hypothetical protein E4U27_007140 [Claviceps purpurea]|nr:hypothetical protein E4U27_007140 [Claviceps purpurea]